MHDIFGPALSQLLPLHLCWISRLVNESIGNSQSYLKVLDILSPQFILGPQLEALYEIVEFALLVHLWDLKHQHRKFLNVFPNELDVLELSHH